MFEIFALFLLFLLNGTFAMAEISIVSSRVVRLEILASRGNRGASSALRLSQSPSAFISTVQVGITVVGILSGMFGAAAFTPGVEKMFLSLGVPFARSLSIGIVVAGITLFSVVLGEIVPKQIGLRHPEKIACLLAPIMELLAKVFAPFVRVLEVGSERIIHILGIAEKNRRGDAITEEEVRAVIKEGAATGALDRSEEVLMHNVMELGDRVANALMTTRQDVALIEPEKISTLSAPELLRKYPHPFIFIRGKGQDLPSGYIDTNHLARTALLSPSTPLTRMVQKPISIPGSIAAVALLERMREEETNAALVLDEFGGFDGVVTIDDLIGSVLGDLSPTDALVDGLHLKQPNLWEADASCDIEELFDALGLDMPETDERRGYHSLGGFVMSQLGKVPRVGDRFNFSGFSFAVTEMVRQRITKLIIRAEQ